jgi:hypothetical protein
MRLSLNVLESATPIAWRKGKSFASIKAATTTTGPK